MAPGPGCWTARTDTASELSWLVSADSTLVRVYQEGAGARRIGGNASTIRGAADDEQESDRRRQP